MCALRLQNVLAVAKKQYRLMLLPSILPALAFTLLAPVVASLRNLDAFAAAEVLERLLCLVGVLLLAPVFLPEQDKNVREMVASKAAPLQGVVAFRFGLVLPVLPLLVLAVCTAMAVWGGTFPFATYWLGGSITAFVLGAVGFAAAGVSDNWVVGCLAPLCYYALNMGLGSRLGPLYLFGMGQTGTLNGKWLLLCVALLLVAATFAYKACRGWLVGQVA